MRRLILAALLAVAALTASAGAGMASTKLAPVQSDHGFPARSWVLSVPAGTVADANSVRVTENGQPVRGLRVTPSSAASRQAFGVMLVIDASESMHGQAIRDAVSAARTFAARRQPQQLLGIMIFNRRTRVLVPPTTDAQRIEDALRDVPRLAPGTNINDAAAQALALLRASGIRAGSVVVLSDGDDTGSRVSDADVVAAAKRLNARIFGIGLASNSFAPSSLRQLADATGADYSAASRPSDLNSLFDALGARLAGEVLIRYESTARSGERVRVAVDFDGGRNDAGAIYRAPSVRSLAARGRAVIQEPFWSTAAAMALASILFAILLASAIALVLRRPRQEALRDRLHAFTAPARVDVLADATAPTSSGGLSSLYARADRVLDAHRWWERFKESVDVARIEMSPVRIAALTGAGSVVLFLLLLLAGAGPAVVLPLLTPFVVRSVILGRARRERRVFEDQLADNLQVMASALRAGHSFSGALASVVNDAPEPTRREFARVRSDEQLGVSIDEALTRLGRRMQNRDLNQIAIVAALQQETGGNTAEVIDRVVESVRERGELRRLIRSLTAQGRMARGVVTVLPIALALFLLVTNPDYIAPLWQDPTGRLMLFSAIAGMTLGSLAIKRIVEVKV